MTDWKEEAFRAFAAKRAEEEAEWQRSNPDKVKIYLMQASDEPPTFSAQGQSNLREVMASLKEHKIEADAPIMAMDSVDAVGGYTGEIAVLAKAVCPVLMGILGAWLQSRTGRKVKLKDGDIEVEAQTVEDAGKLLAMATELRAKLKRKKE